MRNWILALLLFTVPSLICFGGMANTMSVAVPVQETPDLAALNEQLKKTNPIMVQPLPPDPAVSPTQATVGAGIALGKYYLGEYVDQNVWWLKRVRLAIDGAQFHNYNGDFADAAWQLNYVYPISLKDNSLYYTQLDYLSYDNTFSAGLGYRNIAQNSKSIFGVYVINDSRFGGKDKGHGNTLIGSGNRAGFGLEYFFSNFELRTNAYLATGGGGVANGFDLGVQYDFGEFRAPWLSLAGEYYSYSPLAVENILANNGVCALVRIQITPKIRLELGRSYGMDDDSNYFVLSYNLVDVFCPALLYSNGNINNTAAQDLHWKMDQPLDRSYLITSVVPR